MALELADVLAVTGFEGNPEEVTKDDFKKYVDEDFTDRLLKPHKGRLAERIDKIERSVIGTFGMTHKEKEEIGSLEKLVETGVERMVSQIDALKESAKKTDTKKVDELTGKIEELTKTYEQQKADTEAAIAQSEQLKTEKEQTIKSFVINNLVSQVKGSIPFEFGDDKLKQKGFESELASKFDFDLELPDGLEASQATVEFLKIKDKATGNPIKHPTTAAKYLTAKEALESFAAENGVLRKQKEQPSRKFTPGGGGNGNGQGDDVKPQDYAHLKQFGVGV